MAHFLTIYMPKISKTKCAMFCGTPCILLFIFQFGFHNYDDKEKQIDTQDKQMMTKRDYPGFGRRDYPGSRRVSLGMIRLLKQREGEDDRCC